MSIKQFDVLKKKNISVASF